MVDSRGTIVSQKKLKEWKHRVATSMNLKWLLECTTLQWLMMINLLRQLSSTITF